MKNKNTKRTVLIIFSIVIVVSYSYYQLNRVNTKGMGTKIVRKAKSDEEDVTENKESIINIALFGVDVGREKDESPHSDSIIIATIDYKHNKVKLSSILRDAYVDVEGHGKTKINEAYAFGGPNLAIKTLNQNFNLNIKDYVTVNFFTLEKIVDTLGGINVDIKRHEVNEINIWIKEVAELENKNPTLITKSGIQNLNGIQTVAYSRMRHVGNGDFERSDRQRIVLNELINKIQTAGYTKHSAAALELLSYIDTSMDKMDIFILGNSIIKSNISEIEQERFPQDGYCKGKIIKGIWYLVPEPSIQVTIDQIQDYIYNDIKPIPKEPLF